MLFRCLYKGSSLLYFIPILSVLLPSTLYYFSLTLSFYSLESQLFTYNYVSTPYSLSSP